MKKYILYCIVVMLCTSARVGAQDGYNERARKYIEQYYILALAEQKNSGIPASITLGQGILETEAGASELMTIANNHFGIKCNNSWYGPTFNHTDDAPNECFKKYKCAAESFRDHSLHLKNNPRYSHLFALSLTDYASWAICLKKCGYATNPQYSQRLINIIEEFKLQQYTYSAMDSSVSGNYPDILTAADKTIDSPLVIENDKDILAPLAAQIETPDSTNKNDTESVVISDIKEGSNNAITINGLKAFYARKNEMLLSYAVKYNIRYPHLLEINDLSDEALPFDMYVYLEKKLSSGTHEQHTVTNGESLLMIAQEEGMQLKKLMALNMFDPLDEPASGAILELQKQAVRKPEVKTIPIIAHKENAIITTTDAAPKQDSNYITIDKNKAIQSPSVKALTTVADTKIIHTDIKPVNKGLLKQPVAAKPVNQGKVKPGETKKEDAIIDEELARLKANLDKIVYADDSKLPVAKKITSGKPKKETIPEPAKVIVSKAASDKYYTIKKGETAFSIAKRNNITLDQLYQWNNIDAGGVKAGKKIQVKE